jgi:hypothetical protein
MPLQQLDFARRRLSRHRRYRCDVCHRPAPAWELALRIGCGNQVHRCLTERRCDQHFWRPGRSGTISVSFHDAV